MEVAMGRGPELGSWELVEEVGRSVVLNRIRA